MTLPFIPPNLSVTEEGEYIFSVKDLNAQAKQLLEKSLGAVWVKGEISNLTLAKSGHAYFTLKDLDAQIRCTFFSGNLLILAHKIQNGSQVQLEGKVTLYLERGEFQLQVRNMISVGLGLLQQQFLQLKEKLAALGYFDPTRKKPIPKYPQNLAIVTSAQGAALQDILAVLRKRYPILPITVFDSSVQGTSAVSELKSALQRAIEAPQIDLILLTRGGGSLEDLFAFNDEGLATLIFQSPKPIISAIGHEIDFSISDFVADLRAPTPSAAAEMLSPDQDALHTRFHQLQALFRKNILYKFQFKSYQLSLLTKKLIHPHQRLAFLQEKISLQQLRLEQVIHRRLMVLKNRFEIRASQLSHHTPHRRIQDAQDRLSQRNAQLIRLLRAALQTHQQKLNLNILKLNALNPLKVLKRGFSLVKTKDNHLISSAHLANPLDEINIVFHDGERPARFLQNAQGRK